MQQQLKALPVGWVAVESLMEIILELAFEAVVAVEEIKFCLSLMLVEFELCLQRCQLVRQLQLPKFSFLKFKLCWHLFRGVYDGDDASYGGGDGASCGDDAYVFPKKMIKQLKWQFSQLRVELNLFYLSRTLLG